MFFSYATFVISVLINCSFSSMFLLFRNWCQPTVVDCEGDYHYDQRKNRLQWNIALVNLSSPAGSMELSWQLSIIDSRRFLPCWSDIWDICIKSTICRFESERDHQDRGRITCSVSRRNRILSRKIWNCLIELHLNDLDISMVIIITT